MRTTLRRLFRGHTTAVAYLALVVALSGGSAYAAVMITGENIVDGTVTSADLAPGSVTEEKLGTGSVTPSKVYDETLTGADIKDGSLAGQELARDTVTGDRVRDESLTGLDIMDNTINKDDLNVTVKKVSAKSAYNDDAKWQTVTCPIGYTVLGGGGEVWSGYGYYIEINNSYPYGNGWAVSASQQSWDYDDNDFSLTAYAICATL